MENLISDIQQDTIHTASITGIKEIDKRVLDAIKNIDRRTFVRKQDRQYAFLDQPLDIGFGQTISQPFVVALITHLIEPQGRDIVLEVGSGSGYQAAILARLCQKVYAIEIIQELAERSKQALTQENVTNVTVVCSDGNLGLPEHAPFDKIILSAAAHKLPDLLLDQLAIGGILVGPKTISSYEQMLIRIKKLSPTEFKMTDILPVRFVPLVNS